MGSRRTDSASSSLAPDEPDTPASTTASTQSSIPIPSTPITSSQVQSLDASKLSSRRGKITQIACVACRQRKSKCDGARPVCQACQSRPNSKCVFDVTLDQRKPSSLRQRVGELEREVDNFGDILPLLLNALPANLRPRFEGFVQAVKHGGLSQELIEDAKRRLGKPPSPQGDRGRIDGAVDGEGDALMARDEKFGVQQQRGREMLGAAAQNMQQMGGDAWMFNYGRAGAGEGSSRSGSYQHVNESSARMNHNEQDPASANWRIQGWNPGAQQPAHMQPASSPIQHQQRQAWQQASQNPYRSLSIYGKMDHPAQDGSPHNRPIDLNMQIPLYVVQPMNDDGTRPGSGMYSDVYSGYCESRRQLIASGADPSEVLGQEEVDFEAAVNPSNFHNNLSLSTWTAELFGAHRNLRPSDRVACAWMMAKLMRWQIHPTRYNYEQMPLWLRPTSKQCFVPHPANIEYLPWPQVRDALIGMTQESTELTVAISVSWPYNDGEVLYVDPATNGLKLNPEFLAHILQLDNWSLGASVLESMPQLYGLARFDDKR